MRRIASGDAVFQAFDEAIESYLAKNRKAIESEYKKAAGRQVQDSEIDSFLSGLGDSVYAGISPDPAHVKRFVDFYVSGDKMQKAITSAIEQATQYPPARAASDLERIAASLDSASRPSISKLSAAISSVLRRLEA
jgi:hypothetical protein